MANKREFKKYVEAVGASICDEMMIAYYNVEGIDKEKTQNSIGMVLGAVGKAIGNANVFFDKGRKAFDTPRDYGRAKAQFFKQLFCKIKTELANEINEALKEFNAAIPAEAKAQQKAAAEA